MPDLDLETTTGAVRVFCLLHRARPVLIHFGAAAGIDTKPWADEVLHRCEVRWGAGTAGAGQGAGAEPVLIRLVGRLRGLRRGGERFGAEQRDHALVRSGRLSPTGLQASQPASSPASPRHLVEGLCGCCHLIQIICRMRYRQQLIGRTGG